MVYKTIPTKSIRTYLIDLPKRTNEILVEISFPAGYFYAPKGRQETPHLLEHYLAGCLSQTGLDYSASTGMDAISIFVVLDQKNFAKDLKELLTVVLSNPISDETIFEKEKKILRNELAGVFSDPSDIAHRHAINSLLVQPRPFLTELEEFQVSLDDIAIYYRERCVTASTHIFIGAYQPNQELINQIIESASVLPVLQEVIQGDDKAVLSTKSTISKYAVSGKRAYLNLTWPAPVASSDPREQIAMMLISELLCAQNDGFLWQKLQQEHGMVYEIDGHVDYYKEFGFFSLGAPLMPEDLQLSLSLVLAETEKIKQTDYASAWLEAAKGKCLQADVKRWNTNEDRFVWVMGDILARGMVYEVKEWSRLFSDIDMKYLAKFAQKYLDKRQVQVSVLCETSQDIDIETMNTLVK